MDDIKAMMQESLADRAIIEQNLAERDKKDRKIISLYCARNKEADIIRIIELLLKFNGMAGHDKETIREFKTKYPDKLNVKLLNDFLDVKDLYKEYLESGGDDDE